MRNSLWSGVAAMVFVSLVPAGYGDAAVAVATPPSDDTPVHCQAGKSCTAPGHGFTAPTTTSGASAKRVKQ